MSALNTLGVVVVQRSFVTNSTSVGRVEVAQSQLTRLELRLPRPSRVRASFRRESWGDALVKIFKSELQTGEKSFDDLVYVTTETPEETRALLGSRGVRDAIALTIETGGAIEIDLERLVAHVIGHDGGEDRSVVCIVTALLE